MKTPSDGLQENSDFYRTLTNIADLALKGAFLIPCCTATVTNPVDDALKFTHRNRVVLPIASLEPPKIHQNGIFKNVFDEGDHLIRVLVSDCGGHGRALEALQEVLQGININNVNIDLLMNDLYAKIRNRYWEALNIPTHEVHAIARAVLTRMLLEANEIVPGTAKLPYQLTLPRLIKYNLSRDGSRGYFTTPYIWVWMMSHQPSKEDIDPILVNWRFCDYGEHRSKLDKRSIPGAQFWQHFEYFIATFRCLKSKVLADGKITNISTVHAGVRLNGDVQFINHSLELGVSCHQQDTKSESHPSSKWGIACEHATVDVQQGRHCILNGVSAPYGDAFVCLDAQPTLNEIAQTKLLNVSTIDKDNYLAERKKSASDNDFFILYTTQKNLNIDLPPLSGLVDGSNWVNYFGPFAGRAFIFTTVGVLDINHASCSDLL